MNIVGFLVDVLKGASKDISGIFITFRVLLPPAKDRWRSSLPLVFHGPLRVSPSNPGVAIAIDPFTTVYLLKAPLLEDVWWKYSQLMTTRLHQQPTRLTRVAGVPKKKLGIPET